MKNKVCKHIMIKGPRKGEMCQKKIKSGTLCSSHKQKRKKPKAKAKANLLNDPIFNKNVIKEDPRTVERKSIFNITLNSNKKYDNMSKQDKIKFKKIVEYVFNNNNFTKYLVDKSTPDNNHNNLKNINVKYSFEVGGQQNRLHSHIQVDLSHTGFYQIKSMILREFINRAFNNKVHLNIQAQKISTNSTSWSEYIKKNYKNITL